MQFSKVCSQRCKLSTTEFYDKVGRLNPATLPCFTVVPNGKNGFGIVERPTGAVRGVHRGHSAACKAAEQHPCTSAVVRLSHAALDCSHRLRSLRAVRCKLMISPELSTIQHNKERSALLEVEVAEFLKRGGVIKTKRPFL
nr:hypothetical protein [Pseudomonas congelans]